MWKSGALVSMFLRACSEGVLPEGNTGSRTSRPRVIEAAAARHSYFDTIKFSVIDCVGREIWAEA